MLNKNIDKLKNLLDNLYNTYDHSFLETDPLSIVKEYKNERDREAAGFITAMLSLGNVKAIKKTVRSVLSVMGKSPYYFLSDYYPEKEPDKFHNISYRFYKPEDISLLVSWTAQMIRKNGSIKDFFLVRFNEKDPDIGHSLSGFVKRIRALDAAPFYKHAPPAGKGAGHFLTDPEKKSACKRMNMFLRWMVRKDHLDFGLWDEIPASMLIIPVDTHISKVSRYLGLTSLSSPGWNMAVDITNSLKIFSPEDPVKYDFALCRVGMLNKCTNGKDPDICSLCPIKDICVVRENFTKTNT